MLIDGNDNRGIDVGIFTVAGIEITAMRSKVDVPDTASGEHLFSRDCPEYRCQLPGGEILWVLVNHFKSQSGGGGPKRARQAQGVRDIVDRLIAAGEANIVVVGDFNEGPAAGAEHPANLESLFAADGPLVSVYTLPAFETGPRPGTFQSCTLRNRLYQHEAALTVGRVPEITAARHGASDHGAVFVHIDI